MVIRNEKEDDSKGNDGDMFKTHPDDPGHERSSSGKLSKHDAILSYTLKSNSASNQDPEMEYHEREHM